MREIFTDLYKKVLGFFQTQEKETDASKNVACNRLKLVLMQDRTNLTPLLLEKMRGEMIDVLSKYVEMDKEALELNFEQEGEQMALMLSIPVLRAKEEDEINAILEAEKKSKEETSEESEEESNDEQIANLESEEEEEQEEVCSCGCEEEECECEDSQCGCDGGCDCGCEAQAEETEETSNHSKKSKKKK